MLQTACKDTMFSSDRTGAFLRSTRMEHQATIRFRHLSSVIGFAASLFAVWCQIVLLATISLAPLTAASNPLASVPICHADADEDTQPAQQTPDHHTHDCALCAICLAHALPLAIPATPPAALPVRQSVAAVRLDATRARAPPVLLVTAAQPRGPPSSLILSPGLPTLVSMASVSPIHTSGVA